MRDIDMMLAAWAGAERAGDAATDGLLTDDFIWIGPVGFQLPKQAWLQGLTDGDLRYDELTLDEVTTGGTAAVPSPRPGGTLATTRIPKRGATRSSRSTTTVTGGWRASVSASSPAQPAVRGAVSGT
jgi:hypothetical protein